MPWLSTSLQRRTQILSPGSFQKIGFLPSSVTAACKKNSFTLSHDKLNPGEKFCLKIH